MALGEGEGATSQRSKPTMERPESTTRRRRKVASANDRPPGTGVPVEGQREGERKSMSKEM